MKEFVMWDDLEIRKDQKVPATHEDKLSLNGKTVTVDLTDDNHKALVELLAPYFGPPEEPTNTEDPVKPITAFPEPYSNIPRVRSHGPRGPKSLEDPEYRMGLRAFINAMRATMVPSEFEGLNIEYKRPNGQQFTLAARLAYAQYLDSTEPAG